MADEGEEPEASGDGDEPKKGGGFMGKLVVWGVVFVLGVGTGIGTAVVIFPAGEEAEAAAAPEVDKMDIPEPDEKTAFIEFDEVVVNLNDVRYSRYVTCTFSLQVANSQLPAITQLVEDNKVVLLNWLIAHLRDKKLEDVRGKLGHNALRREIHDQFNSMLFTDGIDRIQDILFQDFKVQ